MLVLSSRDDSCADGMYYMGVNTQAFTKCRRYGYQAAVLHFNEFDSMSK